MTLSIFIIAHLLADFYFQTTNMVEKKKVKFKTLFFHSLIYFFVFLLTFILTIDIYFLWFPLFIITLSHFFIDFLKEKLERKLMKNHINQSTLFYSFLIDQCLHLLIIATVLFIFQLHNHTNSCYQLYHMSKFFNNISFYVLLFLIILSPAAIFIRKIFLLIGQKADEEKSTENLKVGSIIGMLERIIIVLFILSGEYGAVGLVLTAKSIARFKQMDDKDFAEKYLVGTLTSLLIAVITTILIKQFLI